MRNHVENHFINQLDLKRAIQPVVLDEAKKAEIQSHRDHVAELARERANRLARKRNALKRQPIFDRRNTLGYKIAAVTSAETTRNNMLWTSLFAGVEVN